MTVISFRPAEVDRGENSNPGWGFIIIIADLWIVYLLAYQSGIWIPNCGSGTKIQIYIGLISVSGILSKHQLSTIDLEWHLHFINLHRMTTPPPGRWGHFLSHYIRHLHIIAMLSDIVVHLQVISCHIQVRHLHLLPVQDKSLYHMYFANNPDKYKKKEEFSLCR